LGRAGSLRYVAAHDLLDAEGAGAPGLHPDPREGEKGPPWHRLAIPPGNATGQARGLLTGVRDDTVIACSPIDLLSSEARLPPEHPTPQRPRQRWGEQPLDGTVTAAVAHSAGDAQHREPSAPHQHGQSHPTAWARGRRRHVGVAAGATCSHVHGGFSGA
jgi:hypothetical protein